MMSFFPRSLGCLIFAALSFPLLAEDAAVPAASPALAWSSYVGGSLSENVQAVAIDKKGYVWLAGSSSSSFDFPAQNEPFQAAIRAKSDVFVAQYRPETNGTATLLFWTWLGGNGDEDVKAMALDSQGRVYLTGSTTSTDFPMAGNTFGASTGAEDVYMAIIDPRFSGRDSLAFSAYYGGSGVDRPTALAIEPSGAFVVAGYTNSTNLPGPAMDNTLQGLNRGGYDAFVIRVNPDSSSALTYATYLGSAGSDFATAVAVDKVGNIWFAGYTTSPDFPISSDAFQSDLHSSSDAFLVRLDPKLPGLLALTYGTLLGGNGWDAPEKLVIDDSGALWLAGYTLSSDFPVTPNAVQRNFGGGADVFVTRIDMTKPSSQIVTYSTYLGGIDGDVLYGFALLGNGKFAVAGYTMSGNFPTAGSPLQTAQKSLFPDAFVSVIDSTVSGPAGLQLSTFFGGSYTDVANSIAADANGNLYIGGFTTSADLRVTDGSTKQSSAPYVTGFITKITR
jgi:hypothetical protein